MKVRVSRSFIALSLAGFTGLMGCGSDTAAPTPENDRVPVLDVALDQIFTKNRGLVEHLDSQLLPVREGTSMDETVIEARKFYDTLGSPSGTLLNVDYPDPFTGAPPAPKATAPLTFEDWKTEFKIAPRNPGESLEAYRARTDVVVYYNKNELGLGRELGCSTFDDGLGMDNPGIACYVTNYGTVFRDQVNSLALAAEGLHPKNTVCISYRPSMPENYRVQFYTYNGAGLRREWAQLDTLGPRPLPQVCMNCHGGTYDPEKHLAKYARFLPMDPNVVAFAETGPSSRAAQEEAIRKLNVLSLSSPLTGQQLTMLDKLYGGNIRVANTKSLNEWTPDAWTADPHRQLFDQVIKPNCITCHAAMEKDPVGTTLSVYDAFASPEVLLNESSISSYVCSDFSMPNSQATLLNFWEPLNAPITISGKTFKTAADALLASMDGGFTRATCRNFETISDCRRAADPEELCGNDLSGRACNRVTGKCVPFLNDATRKAGEANGICKTDGTRGCPAPAACVASGKPAEPGLEGYDGLCMPNGA